MAPQSYLIQRQSQRPLHGKRRVDAERQLMAGQRRSIQPLRPRRPKMPASGPPLLWTSFGRSPTILPHHLLNPLQPDGVLGSEFLNYLLSDEFRMPLQYSGDADSCGSPAINAPPNPLLRRTSLGSGHTTCSQMHPSPFDTQRVLGSHARYHLIRGAFWVLLPYSPHPSSYHVIC